MTIKLSDHFNYGRLALFTLPSIVMMVFTSIYSIVDGLFVSNLVGKDALAAVNLVYPLAMALGSIGFMFGTGGAALVAKIMGEGRDEHAKRLFTFIVLSAFCIAIALMFAGAFALEPLLDMLGATGELVDMACQYGYILLGVLPVYVLANVFQSFFIAAEKPHLGLAVTILAGLTNIVLDYVFIALLDFGIAGAALATAVGQMAAALIPIVYFAKVRTVRLHFAKPICDFRALGRTCVNGSSELMTEVAASVVSALYNLQMMRLVGADGVAAYGVVMYVNFVFTAIFFGFSMGVGPLISFQYGAKNHGELKGLLRKSLILVGGSGICMFALAQLLAPILVGWFVGYDKSLFDMTLTGFRIYSISFLLCGFSIFGSAFFTALNNGKISALISFVRTLVFETSTVLILPIWLGITGVWCAIDVAEVCAICMTSAFMIGFRKRYGYG